MIQVLQIPMAGYLVIMVVSEDILLLMTLRLTKKVDAFVQEYSGSLQVIGKDDAFFPATILNERARHQGTALVTLTSQQEGGTLLKLRYRFPEMGTDITLFGDLVPGSRTEYQMALIS